MSRRALLVAASAAVLVAGVAVLLARRASAPSAPIAADRPDLVLISIDTLRRDHLPFYGYARATAPRLADFAAESVVFDDAVAAHTNTGPSHASVLTGLYPAAHGILQNGYRLRDDVPTLGERLRDAGYRTAAFVSGFTLKAEATGLDRGFEVYDAGDANVRDRPARQTLQAAQAWLRGVPKNEPLFLFFHLFDPHYPYAAPPQHARAFLPEGSDFAFPRHADFDRLRSTGPLPGEMEEYVMRYDGEIHHADAVVGDLLAFLRRQRRYDGSVIVFLSDHGETLDERPWRLDHGESVYQEQARVPLVVRLPHAAGAGRRVGHAVHHVDVLPSVLELLGEAPLASHGLSFAPALRGVEVPPSADRPLVTLARPEPRRFAHFKRVMSRSGVVEGIRIGHWKMIRYPAPDEPIRELFDLAADPAERNDMSARAIEGLRQLDAALERFRAAVGGRVDAPPPALSEETRAALRALGYLE